VNSNIHQAASYDKCGYRDQDLDDLPPVLKIDAQPGHEGNSLVDENRQKLNGTASEPANI
jgi:hypothetical protein